MARGRPPCPQVAARREAVLDAHAASVPHREIGARLGLTRSHVSVIVSDARRSGDARAAYAGREPRPCDQIEARREAILDAHAAGVPHREIAAQVGLTRGRVANILTTARRAGDARAVYVPATEQGRRARAGRGPTCPPDKRALYVKLRSCGVSREAALAEVLREVAP